MSGSGFALGLAIASYEWMAAFFTDYWQEINFLPSLSKRHLYYFEFVEKTIFR
jgi:hypothetical protein